MPLDTIEQVKLTPEALVEQTLVLFYAQAQARPAPYEFTITAPLTRCRIVVIHARRYDEFVGAMQRAAERMGYRLSRIEGPSLTFKKTDD